MPRRLTRTFLAIACISTCSCAPSNTEPSWFCGTFQAEDDMRRCEEKLAFSLRAACQHDGSYELCLPADDPPALTSVVQVYPSARIVGPSRGRAGCDPQTEVLVLLPVEPEACVDGYLDANVEAALCDVAGLPVVRRVFATFYE